MKSNSIKDGVFSARTNELRNSQIAYELPPTRLSTSQPHAIKSQIRHCPSWNLSRGVSEVCGAEDL